MYDEEHDLDLETETAAPDIVNDPVDAQVALVLQQASELALSTPVAELMQHVEGGLGTLYQQAETSGDTVALAHIQSAWQHVQLVAQQAHGSGEALAASIAALGALKTQRDQAAAAVGKLQVQVGDLSNAVTDLEMTIAHIEDDGYEYFMDAVSYNGGTIFTEPESDVREALLQANSIDESELPSHRECGELFEAICNADHLEEDEARELITFIKSWGGRVAERRRKAYAQHLAQYDATLVEDES